MDNYDSQYYSNGYLHARSFGVFPRNGISRSKDMNIFITLDTFAILFTIKLCQFTKLAVNYEGMSFTVKLMIVS